MHLDKLEDSFTLVKLWQYYYRVGKWLTICARTTFSILLKSIFSVKLMKEYIFFLKQCVREVSQMKESCLIFKQ